MFEQEIQYYVARGSALAEGRDSVTLADITASTLLPDALKTFFRAEAHTLWRAEQNGGAPSRFDRSHADVRALETRVETLVVPTAVLTRDEFVDILERAVKLTFNYLCRPQLTLRSFVFRGAAALPIDETIRRIAYFHDYSYFRSVLHPWLERKRGAGEATIAPDLFARTLAKIDEQLMEGMTVQDLHSMLQPMFRWIADAQTPASDRIATDAYVMFFDDKNIGRIATHLATLAPQAPALSTQQVCIVIEQLIQEMDGGDDAALESTEGRYVDPEDDDDDDRSEATAAAPGASPEPISFELPPAFVETPAEESIPVQEEFPAPAAPSDALSVSEPELVTAPIAADTTNEGDLPVAEENIPAQEPEAEEPSPAAETTPAEVHVEEVVASTAERIVVPAEPTMPESEPLPAAPPEPEEIVPSPTEPPPSAAKPQTLGAVMSRTQFGDRSSEFKIVGARSAPPAALGDIRAQIDDDARKKFIKKLFRRNDPEYERALDALNALHTWKDASTYIDSLFLRFGVDPYAKIAIQFTDVVYSRFVKVPSTERS